MSAAGAAETEERQDVRFNLDDDVQCQFEGGACEKVGEWGQVHSCCGLYSTLCTEHKEFGERMKNKVESDPYYELTCKRCRVLPFEIRWEKL